MYPLSSSFVPLSPLINPNELITRNDSRITQRISHCIIELFSTFQTIVNSISTYTQAFILHVSSISCASFLCQKILGDKPLHSYKVANRVYPAHEKLEPLIRDFFPILKQHKLFHVWERFCPRNEEEQIKFLLERFKEGTCFGHTVVLMLLMKTSAAKSTNKLRKELKQHYRDVLHFQALSEILFEIKHIWLQKKGMERENMRMEIERIGGEEILLGMTQRFFHHYQLCSSFSITDKSLQNMVDLIEVSSKKIQEKAIKTKNPLCIPIYLDNINPNDPDGHVLFVQLSPKHRLYDCMLPEMGFFEFSSERELIQFLPKYFKHYYSSLCRGIELPSIFPYENERKPGARPEVSVVIEIEPEI